MEMIEGMNESVLVRAVHIGGGKQARQSFSSRSAGDGYAARGRIALS